MITRSRLESVAEESGFRSAAVEKVIRLCGILRRLDSHPATAGAWLLKGGTALNLLHLDMPRMSIDIDLNFIGAVDRDSMVSARPGFDAALESPERPTTLYRRILTHGTHPRRLYLCRSKPSRSSELADWPA